MKAVTWSTAKKNLRALIQDVCNNSEPTIIVSSNPEDQAVLLSLSDFQALEETAYLLSSPANRAHLEKSLQKMKEGQLIELSEEDLRPFSSRSVV